MIKGKGKIRLVGGVLQKSELDAAIEKLKDGDYDFLITDHHRTRCETATALTVNCSRNGGLIRMKHSHPAYYSLVHLLDDSSISKPSGNPHGTDHKGDYGHKRLCTKPENSPNAIFILRHRGHERTY